MEGLEGKVMQEVVADFLPLRQEEAVFWGRGILGRSGKVVVCLTWYRQHAAGVVGVLAFFVKS